MSLQFERRKYRLTGITEMLGCKPGDPDVYTNYIASKAPTDELGDAELNMLPKDEKGCTVFSRRLDDGALCLMDYMLVGFFKEAAKACAALHDVKQAASKVGTYVFVSPRVIPILRGGQNLHVPDGLLERALRAETMQGPRIALAASERINTPWTMEFEVMLLLNKGTKLSEPITWNVLEDALDYGALKGLGQWRNGGYGRFIWEEMKK